MAVCVCNISWLCVCSVWLCVCSEGEMFTFIRKVSGRVMQTKSQCDKDTRGTQVKQLSGKTTFNQ